MHPCLNPYAQISRAVSIASWKLDDIVFRSVSDLNRLPPSLRESFQDFGLVWKFGTWYIDTLVFATVPCTKVRSWIKLPSLFLNVVPHVERCFVSFLSNETLLRLSCFDKCRHVFYFFTVSG